MKLVGVLYNPKIVRAEPLSAEIARWLRGRDVATRVGDAVDDGDLKEAVAELNLLVVLGGDGTTLRAARLAAPHGVPIFGVNLGRVGFLSEASPEGWEEALERVLAGDYWLEKRLMLQARLQRAEQPSSSLMALNDVVVSRGMQARVVRLHLYVDGDHVTTYTADALIAATPTGSTAYSMAAGGPLLPPQLQNFLVLPVAPHLSFERALVLHQEAEVTIQVGKEYEAMLTADGQDMAPLNGGDEVVITKHPYASCFARLSGPGYFYQRLMEKLSYWALKQ
ncbi:MAG: NAD(+)/NADH kinase [Chloroflexi bacterium]|nr:NAD(+)/NADH kinase [Chloroflexota bacterium]MCI0579426.1 NAD(+)/NADH kinase [Chloroflexota bacterium]MCI0643369.1 NAD(+)/NADH kinase [Chloroflexota bacterium]MCI0730070.1 NAD(+)/NADH kinase [Chloroflexota bacterium]